MLSEHPHVKRLRFQENLVNGQTKQTLVVETDINLSTTQSDKDVIKLNHLKEYLQVLARNDFADFSRIEIRPHANAEFEDDYGNNMIA